MKTFGRAMPCPRCDGSTFVADSRSVGGGTVIRRRRECENGHRFTTEEIVVKRERHRFPVGHPDYRNQDR